MKALVLSEYSQLDVLEVPRPVVGPGEVLVEVAACGICGSDVHGYDGSTGRRIPPLVMGHEAAGMVAEVGEGVARFAVGERVTFDSTVYCGECAYCYAGQVNLCDNRQVVGVSTPDFRRAGAFAEFVSVPERIVYRLPETMPFAEAAMLEAVAVAPPCSGCFRCKGRRDRAGDWGGDDWVVDAAGGAGCWLWAGAGGGCGCFAVEDG